jgi:pyruvate dehydrogenase E2 component (dihydrolipoamide acetyltransferase)
MPIEVVLPKVDMDMENGVIAAWKVAEGDFVRQGDVLFEMETNKSLMEVEAPGTGIIRGLASITGEPIAVGTPVAWIDADGEAAKQTTAAARGEAVATPSPTEAPASTSLPSPTGAPAAAAPGQPTVDAGLRATPLARRTARSRGIDLAAVSGSGPRGRIVEKDVEAHAAAGLNKKSAMPVSANSDSDRAALVDSGESGAGRLVPFSPVRRIVAQRLAESVRNVPHFYLSAQIEMTALLDTLHRIAPKIQQTAGVKPSVTVLLARIVGRLLMDHPMVNASVEGDAVRLHTGAHIGIAMDRDGDLVVPVLRDAQSRTLTELAQELARLRDAVRSRSIQPADMRGGTFTISNLGMYGVDAFTAIINPPESAVLAVGRAVDTPVGRDGRIVLRPMATLSLSSDHRIVDGITAARFMADLRRAIEHPQALL